MYSYVSEFDQYMFIIKIFDKRFRRDQAYRITVYFTNGVLSSS